MSPPIATDPSSYLGVYHSVPTSSYSEISPSEPSSPIREIASLYTDLINLFVSMRYINPKDVHYPPHTVPRNINLTIPARFGFTKEVVDLYQLIPHIDDGAYPNWNHGSDHGEFLMGGEFLPDFRDRPDDPEYAMTTWEQHVIDPFYALHHLTWQVNEVATEESSDKTSSWDDEDGPYIKPHYAVLSDCGNHGSVMILNTKNWHMWLIEQLGGSSDPAFREQSVAAYNGKEVLNKNDLTRYPSRPAVEFLADMISRFKTLQWLPGGLYGDGWGDEIYVSSGWPESFDATNFDRLRREAEDAESLFRHQTGPLARLEGLRVHHERQMQQRLKTPVLEAEIAKLEAKSRQPTLGQAELEQVQQDLENRLDRLKSWRRYTDPWPKEDWEKAQDEIRAALEHSRKEQELMITRQGRFAGVTDEEYEMLIKEGGYDKEIKDREMLLADQDSESRNRRIEREARVEALAVDAKIREKWVNEQVKNQWKPDEWLPKWSAWFEMNSD